MTVEIGPQGYCDVKENYEWMEDWIEKTNESGSEQDDDRMRICRKERIELEVCSKHPTSKHRCEICGALGCFTDEHMCACG